MTTSTDTADDLADFDADQLEADAQQEVADSDARLAELERRVEDGDDNVSADDLAEVTRLTRWARLRVAAAGKRAARVRAAQHDAAVAEFLADYEAFVSSTDLATLRRKYDTATKAVATLRDAVEARAVAEKAVKARAVDLGLETGGDGTPLAEDRERWQSITVPAGVWREALRDAERLVSVMTPDWRGRVHNLRSTEQRQAWEDERGAIDRASVEADARLAADLNEREATVRARRRAS